MGPGQRILKAIGESPFWRVTGRLHTAVYRATGGRVGHAAGGINNLLLTTTGRRSGHPRTVPLAYIEDAGRWVVVASIRHWRQHRKAEGYVAKLPGKGKPRHPYPLAEMPLPQSDVEEAPASVEPGRG